LLLHYSKVCLIFLSGRFNNLIKKFCNKNNVEYININKELKNKKYYQEDMNHLNETGYNKINKKILDLIKL
jgi:lysophospholipase L1-like esterase